MRHYLLVGIFSKWPPTKVALMVYTFVKINKWRKIALIQSQKIILKMVVIRKIAKLGGEMLKIRKM